MESSNHFGVGEYIDAGLAHLARRSGNIANTVVGVGIFVSVVWQRFGSAGRGAFDWGELGTAWSGAWVCAVVLLMVVGACVAGLIERLVLGVQRLWTSGVLVVVVSEAAALIAVLAQVPDAHHVGSVGP